MSKSQPITRPEGHLLGKPLKVLILEGDGLQVISQLVILEDLLSKIASKRGTPGEKLKPCDIFDVICGVGSGGWLALLLGRFHMDIDTCFRERPSFVFDISDTWNHGVSVNRLESEVDRLHRRYLTTSILLDESNNHRARHVFVAASSVENPSEQYLSRTYPPPKSKGALAGSTQYFMGGHDMATSENTRVTLRNKFPNTINMNQVAADEIWGFYTAKGVKESVFVNIGPGPPILKDIRKIVGLFTPKKPTYPDYGVYPEGSVRQFRLVPKQATEGSIRNDTLVSEDVLKATKLYLAAKDVALMVEECSGEIISTDSTKSSSSAASTASSSPIATTTPTAPRITITDFDDDPPPRYSP